MDVNRRSAAIVGAGLIGRAWAVVFARAGWSVRLYDCGAGATLGCARADQAGARGTGAGGDAGGCARGACSASRSATRSCHAVARRELGAGKPARGCGYQAHACSPNSTGLHCPMQYSPAARLRSLRRSSLPILSDARAAWWRIRSIRRIWYRSSNCVVRPGPAKSRSIARERRWNHWVRCPSLCGVKSKALY